MAMKDRNLKPHSTKESFAHALRSLASQKPVDKIVVSEICAKAGYSHATFYRHFRDKYDLAAWEYTNDVGRIMAGIGTTDRAWTEGIADGLQYLQDRQAYLRNLIDHTSGYDSFVRNMTDAGVAQMTKAVSAAGERCLDASLVLCIRAYCHGMTQLICEWLRGSLGCDAESLLAAHLDCVPLPLRGALLGDP